MAAIPIPYTFVTGTIIDPDQMNANFQSIAVNAVSDVGGVLDSPTLNNATVTGAFLFSPDATVDIGSSGAFRPRDLFLARNAVVGGTLTVSGTVTGTLSLAGALSVAGNVGVGGTLDVVGSTTLREQVTIAGIGITDLHGLVIQAQTTGRPLVSFENAASGVLAQLFAMNTKGLAITTNGGSTYAIAAFASGGVQIGGSSLGDPGAGLLSVTGFGIHSFDAGGSGPQVLSVRNTNAGPGNFARVRVGNDVSANTALLDAFASNYAASGVNIPDTAKVDGTGVQGLTLAATAASGPIRFFSGGVTERMRLHASGGLSLGNAIDPGAGGLRVTGNSLIGGSLQVSSGLTAGSVYAIAGIQADGLFYGSGESNPNLFSSGMAVGGGTRTLGGAPDSAAPTAWIYVRYNNTTYQIPVW